jgi:hypothetical protein
MDVAYFIVNPAPHTTYQKTKASKVNWYLVFRSGSLLKLLAYELHTNAKTLV